MQIKKIKRGLWYETKLGIGQAEVVGGTHPPSVKMTIYAPVPRGTMYLKPAEIYDRREGETTRGYGGTFFTCRVYIPDEEAERVQKQDPYFPK